LPTILVIGDFHIPSRARDIPTLIKNKIKNTKFDFVLCTGDLVAKEVAKYILSLGEVYIVRGNMDYLDFPLYHKIDVIDFKIGLIHGTSIYPRGDIRRLAKIAKEMGVDILISGHTHRAFVTSVNVNGRNILLIDPGSATGVWGGGPASLTPSFVILEIERGKAIVNLFEVKDRFLKKEVLTFRK
jgi:hypothetical protein